MLLGGCAGVYAEAAASRLGATVSPSGGAADVDVGSATTIGFNLGAELGSTRQRFALGYLHDSVSFDGGDSSFGASATRYDFNVFNLSDQLKLRLGFGFEFGSNESSMTGGTTKSGSGGGAFGGIGASYFLTWKNAVHVIAGYRALSQSLPGGSLAATGPTARATFSHSFGDARPDKSFVVPLDSNRDITGLIEVGSTNLGCVTTSRSSDSTVAVLEVACPGHRHIEFIQISIGMLVMCEHTQSVAACRSLSHEILSSTKKVMAPAPTSTPPAPVAPVAPEPTPAPAPPAEAPVPPAVPTP
ncbi:hypothetical protein BH11MYX3_BH11MYX3_01280 [soil metagenome]